MSVQSLTVSIRNEFKKSKVKKLRSAGLTPANIIGSGAKEQSVSLDYRNLEKIFRNSDAGRNTLLELTFDDAKLKPVKVLAYNIELDPVTHNPLHVDFLRLEGRDSVVVSCPVSHFNKSKGEVAGGSLLQFQRKVKLKCNPDEIPSVINVDVKDLEIGQALKVKDANISDKITVLSDQHDVLYRVIKQRAQSAVEDEAGQVAGESSDATAEEGADS